MKNNTVDADKEVEEFLRNAGIELTAEQKDLLKRCSGYAQKLIDRGASSWPVGVPLIRKTTAKPAAQNVPDTKQIYSARRLTVSKQPRRTA